MCCAQASKQTSCENRAWKGHDVKEQDHMALHAVHRQQTSTFKVKTEAIEKHTL